MNKRFSDSSPTHSKAIPKNWLRTSSLVILLTLIQLHLLTPVAFAGTISLSNQSTITVETRTEDYRFSGTISISNSGNEMASKVQPSFSLGQWSWRGRPRDIGPNQSQSWNLDEIIFFNDLKCAGACGGLNLPIKGILAFDSTTRYQDLAGYQFSAAEIVRLPFDYSAGMNSPFASTPTVKATLTSSGHGNSFELLLSGTVANPEVKELAIDFLTSEELKIDAIKKAVKVKNGRFELQASGRNLRGVEGSLYAVLARIQWQEGDLRASNTASVAVSLSSQDYTGWYYLLAAFSFVILSSIGAYLVFAPDSAPQGEVAKKKTV